MIKKITAVAFLSGCILFAILWYLTREEKKDLPPLEYKIISLQKGGWGYEVYINQRLCIRQSQIPCIQEEKAFERREDAEKVASLVLNKLYKNERPSVSLQELVDLKVVE